MKVRSAAIQPLLAAVLVCVSSGVLQIVGVAQPAPAQFVAVKHDAGFKLPEIVLQYDPATKSGLNWAELEKLAFTSQYADRFCGALPA